MEILVRQLRELPAKFMALPSALRLVLAGGLALIIAAAVGLSMLANSGESYQYAFTNLTTEDSAEAAQALKNANVPFRLEAGGAALAVPANKVYDARLLLASSGIPRGGGVGFELFDRGDLGISEFTQKINLRRAIEGELARTIGRLAEVRSARVHLTLTEKGLYRDEDKKASAAVVLTLQPGRTLSERALAGVRHLVASAVPGLSAESVTVVDGHGAVLTQDAVWDDPSSAYQRKLERELEQRVVSLLEPVVGAGAVVAKVTASVDASQVTATAEVFDGDNPVLRSERRQSQSSSQDSQNGGGVSGAAANTPLLTPELGAARSGNKGQANSQDEIKNYEISKTTTNTVARLPRLQRLNVALLLDAKDGKPRTDAEMARLGELAKRAVGFDEERGDLIELSSAPFGHADATAADAAKVEPQLPRWLWPAVAGGAVALVLLAIILTRRKKPVAREVLQLLPGKKVAELEAQANLAVAPEQELKTLKDPTQQMQERARLLVTGDPEKAAHLLRAWIAADGEDEVVEVEEERHVA